MTNFLAALAVIVAQVQSQTLTVDEAVERGLKKSLAVQLSQNNAAKDRETLRAAKASSGPSVSIQGTSQRVIDGSNSFTPGFTNRIIGTASIGIDISSLVRLSVRAAELALEAQRANVETTKNTTRYDIKVAYYRLLQAEWTVAIRETTVQAAEKRAKDGKLKNDLGSMSTFDRTRLESDLLQAKLQLDQARLQRNLALAALNQAMREPLDTEWTLSAATSVTEVNMVERELRDAAERERSEVRSLKFRVSQAEILEKVAGNGMKPSMGVQLQTSRNLNPNSFSPASQTTLGLSVTVPIIDSGATRAKVASARKDTDSIRIQLLQAKELVSLEVHNALQNLKNAGTQLDIAESGLSIARESYRLAEVRFANDLGILLDVITAQDTLTKARAALAQANYDYLVAIAALQKAVGNDEYTIRTGSPSKKTLTQP